MTSRILVTIACLFLLKPTWAAEVETEAAARAQLRVAAIQGSAELSLMGSPVRKLAVGDTLLPGSVISTAKGAALDLFLGNTGGTLRLTQLSRLSLEKFETSPDGTLTNLEVRLSSGSLLGLGNQLPLTSHYQVQINNGFVGIFARQFRIGADGFLVAMDGSLDFAYIPPDGKPVELHSLKAPPPVYFYPGEGIVPAPAELQNEILAQVQARIR